jgi:DNA polymerase-3 subunit epsilon
MNSLVSYKEKITGILSPRCSGRMTDAAIESGDYVVLDTELTGLNPKKDSIVSIGAVRMKGGRIDLGNIFYRLINPSSVMRHKSIVIHGITPSEVAEKPLIAGVLSEFMDFCGEDVIVGHFISLDMDFINREARRIYGAPLKNHVVDTCSVHEWIRFNDGDFSRHYGGLAEELNLFSLAKKYSIPFSNAHNAINDAFVTAQLFQRFLSFLPRFGVKTLKDLLRIGKP